MQTSILIVDDEPQIRFLLTRILQQAGHSCQEADCAETAKLALAENTFDLLLTDMNMPGESGADLARHVKALYPQTAIVIVTVLDNLELAKEVLGIGIYGYIVKPFTSNLVLITIDNALRRLHLERQEQDNIRLLEERIAERTRVLQGQLHFNQTLIDAIPLPISYKGLDGRYLGCNKAFATAVGFSREWIVGKTVRKLHPTLVAEHLWRNDQELLLHGGTQVYEQVLPSADGSVLSSMLHKAIFHDIEGNVAGVIGVRFDITELKQKEQALRQSEEKLRSIMDNLQIGIVMISPQLEILAVNKMVNQWFPRDQRAKGMLCYQFFAGPHRAIPCKNCSAREVFATGKTVEKTITHHTEQGKKIYRVLASPMRDENGAIIAALELLEDITESLAVEQELRQAQKWEAVGALAAGIAHEINTPVQYIGDNIHFLEDAYKDLMELQSQYEELLQAVKENLPTAELIEAIEETAVAVDIPYLAEEVPKTIEQSLDGVSRVANIVKAMREFSHPGSDEKSYVDINRAIESTLTISRNEWKYVADMETDLAEELPLLLCLPGEINQVFLNIIVNAAHAISDVTDAGNNGKGVIKVTTRFHEGTVEIRISDSGGGIPDAIRHRIFDPFFTTKKVGKGTGQGLAIARSVVVDKHQGTIRCESETGKGTTFIIDLPLIEPA